MRAADEPLTSLVESRQHFVRMIFRLDFAEDLFDLTFFVNQKSHAVVAHVSAAHEFFLAVSAEALGKFSISVGKQTKRQAEFVDEFLVRLFAVQRNAEQFDAAAFEFRE